MQQTTDFHCVSSFAQVALGNYLFCPSLISDMVMNVVCYERGLF